MRISWNTQLRGTVHIFFAYKSFHALTCNACKKVDPYHHSISLLFTQITDTSKNRKE